MFRIRNFQSSDVDGIRNILASWMHSAEDGLGSDEIERALSRMSASGTTPDNGYVIAEKADGSVVGVAGYTTTNIDPVFTKDASSPVEIVNLYVDPSHTGRGVGTSLVETLESRFEQFGKDRIVVVSGSRNRSHGYPFWTKRYGPIVQCDKDYFGPGTERAVWVK
jgi:predicted N-acetyltransferase YhbS